MVQAVAFDKLLQLFNQARIIQIDPGDIDRDRKRDPQPGLPRADLCRGLRPHIVIQRLDQAVGLKERNKQARTDHAQLRMPPADQGFGAAQGRVAGVDAEFRLKIHFKLLLAERGREVFDQLLGQQFRLVHRIVIEADAAGHVFLQQIRRHLGPVEAALDIQGLVDAGVNAHPEPDAVLALPFVDAGGDLLRQLLIIPGAGAVEQKGIRFAAAGDAARLLHQFQQLRADPPEHFVPVALAVAVVDGMKVIDVHQDRVCGIVLVIDIQLHRVAVEKFLVIQARQLVALGPAKDVAVLGQLNGAQDTGQHDLLHRIGLGDKVNGPQGQAFHLGLAVGGHDDDGNPGITDVGLHLAQQIQTV